MFKDTLIQIKNFELYDSPCEVIKDSKGFRNFNLLEPLSSYMEENSSNKDVIREFTNFMVDWYHVYKEEYSNFCINPAVVIFLCLPPYNSFMHVNYGTTSDYFFRYYLKKRTLNLIKNRSLLKDFNLETEIKECGFSFLYNDDDDITYFPGETWLLGDIPESWLAQIG